MRRIVAENGRPTLIQIDAPACTPGRILVETMVSTVSAGTETAVIRRSAEPEAPDVEYPGEPPYVRPQIRRWMRNAPEPTPSLPGRFSLGYSLAGRVLEVGSDGPDIAVGDLVACAGSQDAHHADIVAVTRSLTCRLPEGLDTNDAAFVAAEVRDRDRNMPLALLLGTGGIMAIYLLVLVVLGIPPRSVRPLS